MENGLALLVLIAIVAGVFWLGFRLGYRYRDNLSLERQKKYRGAKIRIPVVGIESTTAQSEHHVSG